MLGYRVDRGNPFSFEVAFVEQDHKGQGTSRPQAYPHGRDTSVTMSMEIAGMRSVIILIEKQRLYRG